RAAAPHDERQSRDQPTVTHQILPRSSATDGAVRAGVQRLAEGHPAPVLERNVVVQIVALARAGRLVGAAGGEAGRVVVVAAARGAAAVAATAQHGQLALELLDHDFRRVLLAALLVGPFA